MSIGPELPTAGRRIGYARVSTSGQRLDLQLDALKAAGCDVIFTDHGVSGATAGRAGLDDALRALTPGDLFIVFKLDRLGRSVLHLADLLTRFHTEQIHFCSISEGINTATPGGKLTYHVFAAVAEFHRDLIRENTAHGIEAARQRGKRIGRPYALDDADIRYAHDTVARCGVPIAEMARSLEVAHSTLTRAFKRLGLEH